MNPADFGAEVELAASLYFDQVLPAFIEKYFRGGGRAFLWRLLDAHDRRNLSAIDGLVPSERAKKKARSTRTKAPLRIVEGAASPGGSAMLLGLFNHSETFVRETVFASRSVSSSRSVSLFQGSFFSFGWSDEQLRTEIFWTIFHEYIHHFESFLLKNQQVLRGREEADVYVRQSSLEQTERVDRRHTVGAVIRWALGLTVLAGCLAVPLLSRGPAPRDEAIRVVAERAPTAAEVAERQARRRAEADGLLLSLQIARAAKMPARGIEQAIGFRAVYVDGERNVTMNDTRRLVADPVSGLPLHLDGGMAEAWWILPSDEIFPIHLRGLSWSADGGAELIAAQLP